MPDIKLEPLDAEPDSPDRSRLDIESGVYMTPPHFGDWNLLSSGTEDTATPH
jgi:hypothetical protein